jgi:hypothetical protein
MRRCLAISLLLIFTVVFSVHSQNNSLSRADALVQQAEKALQQTLTLAILDDAIRKYQEASRIYQAHGKADKYAECRQLSQSLEIIKGSADGLPPESLRQMLSYSQQTLAMIRRHQARVVESGQQNSPLPSTPMMQGGGQMSLAEAAQQGKTNQYLNLLRAYPLKKNVQAGEKLTEEISGLLSSKSPTAKRQAIGKLRELAKLYEDESDENFGKVYVHLVLSFAYEQLGEKSNAEKSKVTQFITILKMYPLRKNPLAGEKLVKEIDGLLPFQSLQARRQAISKLQEMAKLYEIEPDGNNGKEGVHLALSFVYEKLGQRENAEREKALGMKLTAPDQIAKIISIMTIPTWMINLYNNQPAEGAKGSAAGYRRIFEQPDKALEFFSQIGVDPNTNKANFNDLEAARRLKEALAQSGKSVDLSLLNLVTGDEASRAMEMMASAFDSNKNYAAMEKSLKDSLIKASKGGEKYHQAWIMSELADVLCKQGKVVEGISALNESMFLYNQLGQHGNLSLGWWVRKLRSINPQIATLFAKLDVNHMQTQRSNAGLLARQSFFVDANNTNNYIQNVNMNSYTTLAGLLITQHRYPEAIQALHFGRDRGFEDYLPASSSRTAPPVKLLAMTTFEAEWLSRYNIAIAKIAKLGTEIQELERQLEARPGATAEQQKLAALNQELARMKPQFLGLLNEAENSRDQTSAQITPLGKTIDEVTSLQKTLGELTQRSGKRAVAIYTVADEEKLYVMLLTPDSLTATEGKAVRRVELERKAWQYLGVLRNPGVDPIAPAKELYDLILKPLEGELAKTRAEILMWSLDGMLRYLPMAALHDGTQYLVEKYQHVVFTRHDPQQLKAAVTNVWQGVGFGVAKAHKVTLANKAVSFNALCGVDTELVDCSISF